MTTDSWQQVQRVINVIDSAMVSAKTGFGLNVDGPADLLQLPAHPG